MNKEDIRFKIDQLRKDKMIYALESIAVTFVAELMYLLVTIITRRTSPLFAVLMLIIPLGYFIYMSFGNLRRYKEVKKLESKLYKQ